MKMTHTELQSFTYRRYFARYNQDCDRDSRSRWGNSPKFIKHLTSLEWNAVKKSLTMAIQNFVIHCGGEEQQNSKQFSVERKTSDKNIKSG
jgi:hypothetical protein